MSPGEDAVDPENPVQPLPNSDLSYPEAGVHRDGVEHHESHNVHASPLVNEDNRQLPNYLQLLYTSCEKKLVLYAIEGNIYF